MAVLQKLRGWGIILSILIALPLLLFVIDPSQVATALQSASSKYDVGVIGKKSVSYTDFQQDVERYARLSEIMTGTSASSEQMQDRVREAAWQSLLNKHLFIPNAQAAGLSVGQEEMLDLTTGDALAPVIANNPMFYDENGEFSKDNLVEFVRNLDADNAGSMRLYWDYVREMIYDGQYINKYNTLFAASNLQNPLSLSNNVADNNNTADVDFVMVPVGFGTDTTVVVSSKEIEDFYASHRSLFEQRASRDIEYVVYEVVPSAEDIAKEADSFNSLYEEFTVTPNVKSFLQKNNSERQYSDRYYKAGELSTVNREVEAFVSANNSGTSPVIADGIDFYAVRILETAQVPDSVFVKHILVNGDRALADSLLGVVRKGGDFQALAETYSLDANSKADGETGSLGWMTQNTMIPGFEPVFTAKKNDPFILNTQYGTHIVVVSKTTAPVLKKKVAVFEREAIASQETFNKYYSLANRLATLSAGKLDSYRKAVDSLSMQSGAVAATYSHPMTVYESTDSYGSISRAKEVTRWAFDNKPGKVSNIITVDNKYFFVVAVKEAHKEGIASVKEVSERIRQRLYAEKYAEKKAAEIAEKIVGIDDLQVIADVLGTTVSSQSGVAFASMASRSLDPKFVGAVAAAPEGKVCGPVAGNYGVYVFKVTGRDTGAFYTEDDARNYRNQMNAYASQMLPAVMMKDADVKDNRARFY